MNVLLAFNHLLRVSKIFCMFNFVLFSKYENYFALKISQIMVHPKPAKSCCCMVLIYDYHLLSTSFEMCHNLLNGEEVDIKWT